MLSGCSTWLGRRLTLVPSLIRPSRSPSHPAWSQHQSGSSTLCWTRGSTTGPTPPRCSARLLATFFRVAMVDCRPCGAGMAKYSVYSAVFADGSRGALYYVAYAYPSQQAVIKWDVGPALFDGQWHSVAICFKGNNKHVRTVQPLRRRVHDCAHSRSVAAVCVAPWGRCCPPNPRQRCAAACLCRFTCRECLRWWAACCGGRQRVALQHPVLSARLHPRGRRLCRCPLDVPQPACPKAHGVHNRQRAACRCRRGLHQRCTAGSVRDTILSHGGRRLRRGMRLVASLTGWPQRLMQFQRRRKRARRLSRLRLRHRAPFRSRSRQTRSLRQSRWRWAYSRGSTCTSRGGSGRRRSVAGAPVDKWELICDFHCLDLILRSFLYLRSARKKKLFFVFSNDSNGSNQRRQRSS